MEFEDINTVAVLGAGNMGHGIAEVAAMAGYDVNMRDIKEEFVQDGYDQIEWSLGKLAENDQLSEDEADAALERVTPLVDMEEAVSDADVIIEAVPEKMEIKKDVYGDVEEHAPDRAIFATNTSSLSITELAEVTDRPEQFCGMHFFNPPVRMPLVEVISGGESAEETLDTVEALADDFGKSPVRVHKDAPGFIVNRILVPLMNEASWLVTQDEATIAEVDSTTKYGMGLPMGSFELGDQVGNDVSYHVLEYMHEVLGDAYEPAPLLEEKVENEELGKKTGKGFYDYEDGEGVDIPTDEQAELVEKRLLASMANEVAKLIGNDVAPPESIDEAVQLGAGFPDGPVKLVDEYGLEELHATLEEAYEETGHKRYEPADFLTDRADEGGFYETGEDDDGVDFEVIRIEYPGDMVGHVVLDRPHRMNTISDDVLAELSTAVDLLEDDDEVRAILVTGEGDKAFSAGADVQSMAGSGADPIEGQELSRAGQQAFGELESCEMPVVAGIDGYCLGGGMELATCADMRVASERSEFGQPELDLGLIPGWGGTQRLKHIVGEGRAKEIILTAERYDAETMEAYGFVNEVVDNDDLEDRALEVATDLAGGPPIAQKFTKRAFLAGRDDTDAGLEYEASAFGHLMATDDLMEGITAFMGDGDPEFEGK
ncbi:3-hydroxyacyl-CoA dehydrogenase/enoyl-CoA hydratase family protein [Natronobacterium gregoryi]|uniref:enoyl-CoA hydratase n=2 Tax=Natronobacterium gregoryi TaxID=44930 RepID=L0AF94_NATGS|nr:3-hydroxyacyl-CoA dehydrogenase/enoyl-CoA hydratase family protein [Natronobacterium gregoryi]AFZ71725.1 3-hydroxyacyl-CoA dehydrogenase [Natronobacterium gregoryi SP2]ELY72702.1 3-hydroxyacyl-CoA dehydrogenase NAD-binding protein [Natronobacterium gregoryi SP2]PLK20227.1 3-hydroxyacyl-CoA dehydrogenase [Natronobacterium gregoryi SP2]SFJ26688.1 3-hydroxyacyl-CoA dehydrogenase /Enoyl-CoA hydratase [Natronobacterium gregoryi]